MFQKGFKHTYISVDLTPYELNLFLIYEVSMFKFCY